MANKINELAVVKNEIQYAPSAQELHDIREEMQDMDRFPYGRIQIAAAGAGVFKVTDPGEEEAVVAMNIQGVILFSHKANGLWAGEFGKGDDKAPVCASLDGEEGHNTETGELIACEPCPYNQFGSGRGGRGKACKNMRRLYILREGDIFPMIMTLPPTALQAYDKYRTKVMLGRKKMYSVITRVTLKTAQNKDGIDYSVPVFEAVAILPPGEAERVKQYADTFSGAAQNFGISGDDYATAEQPTGEYTQPSAAAPEDVPVEGAFEPIGDEELPFAELPSEKKSRRAGA